MKKTKKMLASLLSATLAVSSFSSFSASAYYFDYESDSEKIVQEMTDKGYAHIPESIDDFFNITFKDTTFTEIVEMGKVDDLWFAKEEDQIFMWFMYKRKINDFSIFYFDVSPEDYSAVVEELKAEIGYSDKADITVMTENWYDREIEQSFYANVGIKVNFSENGVDLNYMITEKIASILKEKYDVTKSKVSFGRSALDNMRVTMQTFPISNVRELEAMTEEQLSEYIEEFNSTLADNGFDVRSYKADDETLKEFNENNETNRKVLMCLDVPEDMTVQEKLRYTSFVHEHYGNKPSLYALTSASSVSQSFDILEFENSYNHGDANEDGAMNIADAAAVVQALGNKDKYGLSAQGEFNADIDGNGLTGADALEIQIMAAEAGMPE